MVERHLAKVEVAGSSPVIRSKIKRTPQRVSFLLWTEGASSHIATISPAKTAPAVLVELDCVSKITL